MHNLIYTEKHNPVGKCVQFESWDFSLTYVKRVAIDLDEIGRIPIA